MEKALSRNPNMLRTMIGLGLVLIIVLSFAVHKNTMNSEYYRYETTNDGVVLSLEQADVNLSEWYVTTMDAYTWINLTVFNAPVDTSLVLTSSSTIWHHSPLLGEDADGSFNCEEYEEVSESCEGAYSHSMSIENGDLTMRGRISFDLPIEGVGYVQSENSEEAASFIQEMINDSAAITTWTIKIVNDEGEVIDSLGIEVELEVVEHQFVDVEEFKLKPFQETLYSLATLIGCFGLMIVVPMMAYFAGVWKAKLDEEVRLESPPPNK
tara:strand:- start:92886 stop:93686 length:801 start_codon:yes stop_codon:yes gene_type:complete